MANKYLAENAGAIIEVEGLTTSAGAGDSGKIVALNASGLIDDTMLPDVTTTVAPASENLTAGNYVNIWNDGGTLKVRKADATDATKPADGYVLANVTAPANATVYHIGVNSGVSGKTVGAKQYLATTAGAATETAPSSSGNIVQVLGKARSATEIITEITNPIVKA